MNGTQIAGFWAAADEIAARTPKAIGAQRRRDGACCVLGVLALAAQACGADVVWHGVGHEGAHAALSSMDILAPFGVTPRMWWLLALMNDETAAPLPDLVATARRMARARL